MLAADKTPLPTHRMASAHAAEFSGDIKTEQQRLLDADLVIVQFPLPLLELIPEEGDDVNKTIELAQEHTNQIINVAYALIG